jgi:hypothetical protein
MLTETRTGNGNFLLPALAFYPVRW